MSNIDLTSFQATSTDTVVTMPEGDTTPSPLMRSGPSTTPALDTITQIGALKPDEDGACPSSPRRCDAAGPTAGRRRPDEEGRGPPDKLPLMARFQVLEHVKDQDLGGLSPSGS